MKIKRDRPPGRHRFFTCEVIMKFLRDRVEQRWQLEIRRRRGGVEQPIERGVTYERTGPYNVHKSPHLGRGRDNLRVFNGTPAVESEADADPSEARAGGCRGCPGPNLL